MFKYLTYLEALIQAVGQATSTGQTTVPVVKLNAGGKHLEIGPTPITIR